MTTDTARIIEALTKADDQRRQRALLALKGQDGSQDTGSEPFRTLKDVARQLGFVPSTLWRWGVPGHLLGGRRRFKLSEVTAYLESPEFPSHVRQLRKARELARK